MKNRSLLQAILPLFALASLQADELNENQMDDALVIQCANLVYANDKTSVCFASKFLEHVQSDTILNVITEFRPARLSSDAVFESPVSVISGEGSFSFSKDERENLKRYLTNGGFLIASPGCSDETWHRSFTSEIKAIFPDYKLVTIPMDHPVFSMVYDIPELNLKSGGKGYIEGMEIDGRLALIYSKEGLNDVGNAKGCCCCGGNMIRESQQVNVNLLTYALFH